MAAFELNRTNIGGRTFGGRLSAIVTNALSAVIAWNDARATRNALTKLTNRELDDIGLVRGDIDRISNTYGL